MVKRCDGTHIHEPHAWVDTFGDTFRCPGVEVSEETEQVRLGVMGPEEQKIWERLGHRFITYVCSMTVNEADELIQWTEQHPQRPRALNSIVEGAHYVVGRAMYDATKQADEAHRKWVEGAAPEPERDE